MDKGYARFFQRNPMPENEARKLFRHMRLKSFSRGEFIVKRGEFNSDFHVLDRGIWSAVQHEVDYADITLWFAFSGECVFNVWSFVMGKPSPIDIISETDSTAFVIDKDSLEEILSSEPDVAACLHKIILGHLAFYENRLLEMSRPSRATDKYKWISEWHPELLREVPVGRIASFLGITIQSLSRIRRHMFDDKTLKK